MIAALSQFVGGIFMGSLAVVSGCAAEEHVRSWVRHGNRRDATAGVLMWGIALCFAYLALLIWMHG